MCPLFVGHLMVLRQLALWTENALQKSGGAAARRFQVLSVYRDISFLG